MILVLNGFVLKRPLITAGCWFCFNDGIVVALASVS
jgi:hypothetical protein